MRPYRRIFFHLAALLLGALPLALPAQPPLVPSSTPSLLLIASRQLTHPVFRESVVLVTRHGRGGPVGVIINRPLEIGLDKLFPSLPAAEKHKLYSGGPVDPTQISYLFRGGDGPSGTLVVAEQTYIGRSPALLGDLLRGARQHTGLRVIAGYAGWAPGQLENEIARGDWLVLPVDSAAVFDKPAAAMWPELHRRATQTSARLAPSAAGAMRFADALGRHTPMLLTTLKPTIAK